jgi:HSP20 family protein
MERWSFEPELRLLDQLRGGMGRLFSDFFASATPSRGNGWRFERAFPALNVWEDGDVLHAECELPGVKESDLEVTVVGKELTIKGQRRPHAGGDAMFHRQERDAGQFHRVVQLPVDVDASAVKAQLHDGVLTLTLPKTPEAKPRKIEVKASSGK